MSSINLREMSQNLKTPGSGDNGGVLVIQTITGIADSKIMKLVGKQRFFAELKCTNSITINLGGA